MKSRDYYWMVVMAMILPTLTNAQINFGFRAGLNVSDIALTNYINPTVEGDYQPKLGFHAGPYITADLENRFMLTGELLYSRKGVRAISTINLHYVVIPLLAQYKVTDRFLLELGPEFGYLVSATSDNGNVGNVWNNKLDVGIDAGATFVISRELALLLRYNAGISSVVGIQDDTNFFPMEEPVKYQNRVVMLSLAYRFGEYALNH